LKGNGYYVTDFKNSGPAKPACPPCAASGSCPVAG
jgi:predicted nucleic acid-binding Zn ribbon protein